jgi:DNA invertase Pin-like site-specific DNA recombinase
MENGASQGYGGCFKERLTRSDRLSKLRRQGFSGRSTPSALCRARERTRQWRQSVTERRYVAYYRVSTPQQGRSGLGLEGQQLAVRHFLETVPGELLAELTEVESGAKSKRPKFLEALRLSRVYSATLLIARLDRLSRCVALISKLMETGADFVAADFPEANWFTIHILAAVAEYELQIMSERSRAACAAASARGVKFAEHLRGCRVRRPEDLDAARAAKFKRAKDRAVAMAPLLRELCASGKSLHGIAVELTRLEIQAPRNGTKWYPPAVRQLFLLSGEPPPEVRLNGPRHRGAAA